MSTTLTNSLWSIITIDPLPSKCVVYDPNDRKAPHRLGLCHAISLRCGGDWDLGIGHIGDGLFFDLTFEMLSPGGAVASPPVDDDPGFFTGTDAALR